MTVNHLAMSESVPRVPKSFLAGPSGTDVVFDNITPKG
jgi:hypothetical protein